jgi:hypothetical protein
LAGVRAGIVAILLGLLPVATGSRAVPVSEGLREVFVFHGVEPLDRIEVEQRSPRRAAAEAEIGTATLLFTDGMQLPLGYSRSPGGGYRFRAVSRHLEQAGGPAPTIDLFVAAGPEPGPVRCLHLLLRPPYGPAVRRNDPALVTLELRPDPGLWLVTGGGDRVHRDSWYFRPAAVAALPDGSAAVAVAYRRRPTLRGVEPFRTRLRDRARRDFTLWGNVVPHRNLCLARFTPEGDLRWVRAIGAAVEGLPQVAALADGSVVVAAAVAGLVRLPSEDGEVIHAGQRDVYSLFVARYESDGRLAWVRVGRELDTPVWGPLPWAGGVVGLSDGRCVVVGAGNLWFDASPGPPWITSSSFALCFDETGKILGDTTALMYQCRVTPPSAADPEAFFVASFDWVYTAFVRRIRAPDVIEWTATFPTASEIRVESVAPLPDGRVAVLLTEDPSSRPPDAVQRLVYLGTGGAVLSDTPLAPGGGLAQELVVHPAGGFLTVDTTGDAWDYWYGSTPRDLLLRRRDESGRILASVTVADRCDYGVDVSIAPSADFLTIGVFVQNRTILHPDDEEKRTRCFSAGEQDLLLLRVEWP